MQASYRYGDRDTGLRYPLPVASALPWRRRGNGLCCQIALPPCPAGHIIVPSLSVGQRDYRYQVTLQTAGDEWPLQAVPSGPSTNSSKRAKAPTCSPSSPRINGREAGLNAGRVRQSKPAGEGAGPVSLHIDCFHTEADLPASRLLFQLDQTAPPQRHLVTASIRPLEQQPPPLGKVHVITTTPPAISQMEATDDQRHRICSPTAMAMLLKAANSQIDWLGVVGNCFDERTQSYGCWPMAIRCAGTADRLGAVEALSSWEPVVQVLRAGQPLAASIDYGPNELPGAPLAKTGGHLVACYGIDGDFVLVNDPAAADVASVPKRYGLAAFGAAWLRYRGAAYILAR